MASTATRAAVKPATPGHAAKQVRQLVITLAEICLTCVFFHHELFFVQSLVNKASFRLLFLTFRLKIFIRKNTQIYITNQILKIILSKQIFNLKSTYGFLNPKSESDLRFCISLDSDSCNNRISIKSELSLHCEIKYQSPFIRTPFLFFGHVLRTSRIL